MQPKTWNTDAESLGAGRTRSRIGVGWRNFRKLRESSWRSINGEIASDLSVTAFPGSAQFPASSQGECDLVFDGGFSMKRHIEERNGDNPEPGLEMKLQTLCQHNVTGHINPDNPRQIIYPNAWDSANLRYGIWHGRSARIEKVVEIYSMPPGTGDVSYKFLVRSSQAQVFTGVRHDIRPWNASGQAELNNADAFISLRGSQLRGTVLRTPVAWYYEGTGHDRKMIKEPIRVTFQVQSDGESVIATKHIPRSLVTAALAAGSSLFTDATFNPDANPESSSVDGGTARSVSSESWSVISSSAGTFGRASDSQEDLKASATGTTDRYSMLWRLHHLFDTSSIGSGQSVDSASLTLNVDRQAISSLGLSWNVYSSNPASNTDITSADHVSVGTTAFSTSRVCNAESTDPTSVVFTFNPDGENAIAVDDVSKFAIAFQEDAENGTYGDPTWTSINNTSLRIRMSEYAGTGDDPLLTVEHSAGGGGGGGGSVHLSNNLSISNSISL